MGNSVWFWLHILDYKLVKLRRIQCVRWCFSRLKTRGIILGIEHFISIVFVFNVPGLVRDRRMLFDIYSTYNSTRASTGRARNLQQIAMRSRFIWKILIQYALIESANFLPGILNSIIVRKSAQIKT